MGWLFVKKEMTREEAMVDLCKCSFADTHVDLVKHKCECCGNTESFHALVDLVLIMKGRRVKFAVPLVESAVRCAKCDSYKVSLGDQPGVISEKLSNSVLGLNSEVPSYIG